MLCEILGLSVDRRIDSLSAEVGPRESIALVGANGAGKTTLLRSLSGALKHDGIVKFRGSRIASMDSQRRALCVAYVAEDLRLDFDWTLEEVVLMGRYAHTALNLGGTGIWGPRTPEAQTLLDAIVDHLGLDVFWERPFRSLSGGERQLGLLARAWFQQSSLVLFDETTSKLDFDHKEKVVQWVTRDHPFRGQQAMVWVDHDHGFLQAVAPRGWLLSCGKLVWDGSTSEALNPARLRDAYQKKTVVPI